MQQVKSSSGSVSTTTRSGWSTRLNSSAVLFLPWWRQLICRNVGHKYVFASELLECAALLYFLKSVLLREPSPRLNKCAFISPLDWCWSYRVVAAEASPCRCADHFCQVARHQSFTVCCSLRIKVVRFAPHVNCINLTKNHVIKGHEVFTLHQLHPADISVGGSVVLIWPTWPKTETGTTLLRLMWV